MSNDHLSERVTALEQRVDGLETTVSEIRMLFAVAEQRADERFDAVHQVLISLQTQVMDNHRQMLVLHEDLVARIAVLGEGWDGSRAKKNRGR